MNISKLLSIIILYSCKITAKQTTQLLLFSNSTQAWKISFGSGGLHEKSKAEE